MSIYASLSSNDISESPLTILSVEGAMITETTIASTLQTVNNRLIDEVEVENSALYLVLPGGVNLVGLL